MTTRASATSGYDINDPVKIQGRDEVLLTDRSLAALRLGRALDALGSGQQRILAPGAGAGRYARALAHYRPDWEVVAGDLSPRAVEEARQLGGGPEYSVFDVLAMPFADRSFDGLVYFDLLEHVDEPGKLIAECQRVLRPGGILHFFVPLEGQPGTLYSLLRDDWPIPIHRWKRDHVGHIQRFRESDVLSIVWDAGFEVTQADYSFHLIGQMHDIIDYWQRERMRGGPGIVPLPVVQLATRLAFLFTWRGAYVEDRLYGGSNLASGLHVTARSRG